MDLSFATASELVDAVSAGTLSSRELLDHVAARIDTHNPALNAVVTLDLERAADAAAAADDAQARGEPLGPLHGLVITIKDVWETAGLRTTSGAPELRDYVPSVDAITVGRLRAAGAVIAGKTNTPLYASDHQTFNELFGQTNNPWDLNRTPGGSSGGAAAAVAAGLVALEHGSDIGGSIRVPAAFCGIYGLKPTWAVVPSRGHIPGPPGSLVEADVNSGGPMARSLADLALALDVIAGPLPEDAPAWQLALPDDNPPDRLDGLRFGVTFDDDAYPVASEVRAAIRAFVDRASDAGAAITEEPMPVSVAEAADTWNELVLPLIGSGLPEELYEALASTSALPGDPASAIAGLLTARFRDRVARTSAARSSGAGGRNGSRPSTRGWRLPWHSRPSNTITVRFRCVTTRSTAALSRPTT